MKCWICGADANTGEHLVKASDLKAVFRKTSQNVPLFFSTEIRRNIQIGNIKRSQHLKSNALICAHCNNARTAPNDEAWKKLSKYLQERKPPIKEGEIIELNKIFQGTVKQSMLNVHLFFIKLFGCAIVEHKIPIDIAGFSEAIMNQNPHPLIHLAFSPSLDVGIEKHVGRSDLNMDSLNGKCVYATWFYIVDRLQVNVMYAEPKERRKMLVHAWHPTTISKRLRICQV